MMKNLIDYIKEQYYSIQDYSILEMATIGKNIPFGNDKYRVEIHGPASKDREQPHIHIYSSNDSYPYNKFNFEVSLVDILCYDEINLIRMKDISKHKNITNRTKCSWDGYMKMFRDFEDWLYKKPTGIRGEYIDNLDALIFNYDLEANGDNAFLNYIQEKGLKIHPSYSKYFDDETKEKFKNCFE